MHVLTCPVCQGTMREISRDGVLIDTCTQCRGVWLDRGELEKISEILTGGGGRNTGGGAFLAGAPPVGRPSQPMPSREYERRRDDDDDDDEYRRRPQQHDSRGVLYGGKPAKSKVSRFLDFFD